MSENTITESDRILASGAPVVLSDGSTVFVKYGMRGIKALETRFGSVTGVDVVLAAANEGNLEDLFHNISALIWCGLLSNKNVDNSVRWPHEDDLDDDLDPTRLREYLGAVAEAFKQAFPQAEATPGNGEGPKGPTSRGAHGSTSSRSRSAAQKSTSGR